MMPRLHLALVILAGLEVAGCAQLRGRKKIQEGSAAYASGDFVTAAARFTEAAAFVPEMPLVWLNRGYACRELMVPGAGASANGGAGSCALESFKRLRDLAPADPRGDRLYVQTLLDLGEYPTIERKFSLRHERAPADLDVVLVLEQVYSKMGRWRDALAFYRKAAALRPQDAEAQYATGTYIWQVLHKHGGGAALAEYDPRPNPARASRLPSPSWRSDDIVGAERVALSQEGILYLERALALRPKNTEALTYIGLLYRQQSFALFDDPSAWERVVGQAVAAAARAVRKP